MTLLDTETYALLGDQLTKRNVMPVFIATLVVCQLSFLGGISQGYSSILLSQLKSAESPLQITEDEGSWIASLGSICRPIGALVEGYIVDKYGRKTTVQITSILISAAWILTYFSRDITMLYISRILLSFGLGMIICVGLYIAEICHPAERGTLLSLITPMTMGGTLVVYILGYLFQWQTVAIILCLYCLAIFGISFIIPETHIWYMINSRKSEAVKALMWFRRNALLTENEIAQAEDYVKNMESHHNYLEHFRDPAVYKPFLILTVFSIFQQQVGYNIITYYANDFFKSFESSYDSNVLSITFAAISTAGSFILMAFVHKYNRKSFLSASGLGMAIMMLIAGFSIAIRANENIVIICVFIYVLFCMLGMIDIPWMMIGEFFPTKVRGTMSANVTVIIFIIQFVTLKTYPALSGFLGVSGLVSYFALFCFMSVIFAKVYFPETKDKSLFDIEDNFRRKGTGNQK